MPPVAYGVALTLALQGALAIKDTTAEARVRTRLGSAAAGFAAIALVSVLRDAVLVRDLLFLAVAFVAVLARRWGARWNAVGMFGFMATFIAAYFGPAPSDLPIIAVALVLSVAIAHGVRDVLLPDRPAEDLRRVASVVDRRVGEVASALRAGLRQGWTDANRHDVLLLEQRVRDGLLVTQTLLPAAEAPGGTAPPSGATQASIQLFDLHLALETTIGAAFEGRTALFQTGLERTARLRQEVRRTLAGLTDAMLAPDGAGAAEPPPLRWSTLRGEASFRTAVQVTLACLMAMAGGYLVSEQRWFWAVLTAFLVFTNTQSRGDALLRGVDRSLGTALGVVVGIMTATLLGGSLALSLPLIAVCVFAGFYLLQSSYGALTFFVTVALSLIYGLIGSFTPGLLVLRLEETLIGAGAGMFVSFFVFPRSTIDTVRGAVDGFLADLDRLLVLAGERREGNASNWRLVAVTQALDRRHALVADAVRPLASGWLTQGRRRETQIGLLRFTVLGYWAHRLAGAAADAGGGPAADEALALCRQAIGAVRGIPGAFFERADPVGFALPETLSLENADPHSDELLSLHAIRHVLAQVADAGRAAGAAPVSTALPRPDKEPADPGPARA